MKINLWKRLVALNMVVDYFIFKRFDMLVYRYFKCVMAT